MTILDISYGRRTLNIRISFSERKRLSITVNPDLTITAKSPDIYAIEDVQKRIARRASWIVRQLDYFEQFHPQAPKPKYVSGETHYYLGRQYRLRIRRGEVAQVRLKGRFFEMELPDSSDNQKARQLLVDWYSVHAKSLLTRRLLSFWPVVLKLGADEPQLRFRRMQKRWGSCSPNGVILLNTELVKAPVHSIDYVLVHELCHLLHPQHGTQFQALLRRILPDWEKRKERLERVIL